MSYQQISKSNSDFSIHKAGSAFEEDQIYTNIRSSTTEIGVKDLSGDEAIEKSFMQSMTSSIWTKNGQKTSIFLTSAIVMKSMVGVGILGIPYVARNFGVLFTILLMATVAILGLTTSKLLLKSKNLCGRSNYSTIGFHIFRHKWIIIIVNLSIIITNLGVCLSELLIFGDTTQNLANYFTNRVEQPFYLSRSFFIIIMSICLFPLLIVKSIEKLKFVSVFAIMSLVTFSVLVIYNFAISKNTGPGFTFWIPDDFSFARAMASMPTIILAYSWQFNLFPVLKGMIQPTDKRLMISTIFGFGAGTLLYTIVGILGYATYGRNIDSNYLNSIDEQVVGPALFIILNSTFVISSTFTLPIIFFSGRNNFIQLLKSFIKDRIFTFKNPLLGNNEQDNTAINQIQLKKRSQKIKFYVISTLLFIAITIGAIFIRKLGLVYNLLGSISCNAIQLGLPTLYYLKLKLKKGQGNQGFFYIVSLMFLLSIFLTFFCVICEFI